MKKYLLIVTVFALGLSLVACSGKKSTDAGDETIKQEEVTTASESVDDGDVIAKYESLIEKAFELQGKVTDGDADAAQELGQVGQDLATLATEIQNALADLSQEQQQKFAELAQKWAAASNPQQ